MNGDEKVSALRELMSRYNPWWDGGFTLPGVLERNKLLPSLLASLERREVVFLTGLRRVGKTTLMRQVIRHLTRKSRGASAKVFYASLDDYAFKGMSLAEIIDEFRATHRHSHSTEITVFLDEVTALPNFEIQLKNLHDMGGVKIYASSSSASVLREGSGHLTGRKRMVVVSPLDFEEYLQFKGISLSNGDGHLRKEYFEEYMRMGGMPEHVMTGDVSYLRELVDDIICKDIAAVNGVRDLGILRDFFMLLMERAGKSVSINKMSKVLGVSPDTSRRFIDYFERAFLVSLIQRNGKLNERLRAPKKLYAIDLGIRVMSTGYRDIGSLFENYVYNLIAHRRPGFLLRNGIEIDFLTEDGVLIESKYYDKLRPKQKELFDSFPAEKKLIVDSVEALSLLTENRDGERHGYPLELHEERSVYKIGKKSRGIPNLGCSTGKLMVKTPFAK